MITRKRGFSLIEVVLAVAILGLTIVAVVGLLGVTGRAITDVRDTSAAARISELLSAELQRNDFSDLTNTGSGFDRFILYATPAGDHVALAFPTSLADNNFDPNNIDPSQPRGIAPRDRYYRIVVTRMRAGGSPTNPNRHLQFNETGLNDPGSVSFSVQIEWPYNVQQGPGFQDAIKFDPSISSTAPQPSPNASVAYYNLTIRP